MSALSFSRPLLRSAPRLAPVVGPSRALSTTAPVASGHSRWSKIRHKKGAVDAARGTQFSKILTEVHTAFRIGGLDPEKNPRLAKALALAKDAGVPKANIEGAFARARKLADGSGKPTTFEAMGGGGKVAFIVECITDNQNRTTSRVKELLGKGGARVAPVAFMFERKGVIRLSPQEGSKATFDSLFDAAVEAGAEDVKELDPEDGEGHWEVVTSPNDLSTVTGVLSSAPNDALYSVNNSELAWIPNDPVEVGPEGIDEEKAESIEKAIEMLEEEPDVVRVWTNLA